jgi:hypothetical protein
LGAVTTSCNGPRRWCKLALQLTNTSKEYEYEHRAFTVVFTNGLFVQGTAHGGRIEAGATATVEVDYERPDIDIVPLGVLLSDRGVYEARLFD